MFTFQDLSINVDSKRICSVYTVVSWYNTIFNSNKPWPLVWFRNCVVFGATMVTSDSYNLHQLQIAPVSLKLHQLQVASGAESPFQFGA